MKQTGRFLFSTLLLLILTIGSVAFGANVGDRVDYMNGFLHGTLIGIEKTSSEIYWTAQLDGIDAPLVAPASSYSLCDEDQSQCKALYFKQPVFNKRTARIQKDLMGAGWFKESHLLGRKKFLLEFKGYSVPILVKSVSKNVSELQIVGTQNEKEEVCLSLVVDLASKSSTLSVLRTQEDSGFEPLGCPIPLHRRGSYLLSLVDALALSLGIENTHVTDGSKVSSSEGETSLQILKIFEKGQGWYEENGYVPDDLKDYRERVRILKTCSLKKLQGQLDQNQKYLEAHLNEFRSEEMKEVVRRAEKKRTFFSRYLKRFWTVSSSDELGVFLQWLLKEDPTAYFTTLERVLRHRTEVGGMILALGGDTLVKDHRNVEPVLQLKPDFNFEVSGDVEP